MQTIEKKLWNFTSREREKHDKDIKRALSDE